MPKIAHPLCSLANKRNKWLALDFPVCTVPHTEFSGMAHVAQMFLLGGGKVPKDIAAAFGLHPDALELLADGDDATSAGSCQSCEALERKCAELAAELAECRSDVERCPYQIEHLLRMKSMPAGAGDF